ncbi:MAG: hypothetical protein ACYDEE_11030 [Ignavibacteriaceae bacterium]
MKLIIIFFFPFLLYFMPIHKKYKPLTKKYLVDYCQLQGYTCIDCASISKKGENETVIGIDSQVYHSRGGKCFLDIDGDYPDNTFTAVIFKSDVKKFKDIDKYEGKEIQVKGKIKEYNGKPEIILKSKSQIEIIRKGN